MDLPHSIPQTRNRKGLVEKMRKLAAFFRKETVLCIAALLALISAVFVPPSAEYISYLDFRVLALLFCLMLVVSGLQNIGAFRFLGISVLKKAADTRQLTLLLVGLCFLSSMLITNDVALITFVPFAIMLLSMAGQEKLTISVVVLQTVAANLGSMLTPIGNPQNLYLYSSYRLSMGQFILYMLPLTLVSFILLFIAAMLLPKEELDLHTAQTPSPPQRKKLCCYIALFLVCICCVLRLLPWQAMLGVLVVSVFLIDRSIFRSADYFLLLTFVCFFLFIGNMERIPAVSEFLHQVISGKELLMGALLSQCISNVPAAILLSGFTSNARPLLYGVNIGGLGTLVASLASVISFKSYGNTKDARKGSYMKVFTFYNIVFLAILYTAALLLLHIWP